MEIEGQLVHIIYRNDINSYTVAEFETIENEEITVVGYLPFISEGDSLKITGSLIKHPEYGEQLKIATFEKLMPSTPEALEKYLANGSLKGIGPATAKKIVNTFGEDTINIIKLEPQKLTQIKGITKEKAIQIAEDFLKNWEIWQLVGFLDQFGIGPQGAESVYRKLGETALEQIQDNPYILIDVASKVNFEKIDYIAMKLGFEEDNEKRIRSGIKFALSKIAINGHSTTIYENLLKFVEQLLGVNQDTIENTIINMKSKGELILEDRDDGSEWVYLKDFFEAEENIAEKIIGLNSKDNIKKINNLDKEIKKIEKNIGIKLSKMQKEAINAINENNVCVITGGPGTGKTTIIKAVIELYRKHGKKTVLCAPTGRAAKRMTEATGEEAKTLHRLLELTGSNDSELNNYSTELFVTPIDGDIIIVDEMSMVDMFLMNYLLKGVYLGTKLVLVGDIDQLPSVGPGAVLKDIIKSDVVKTVVLNQIFRQAAKSKIIVNAHRVNEGEAFIEAKESKLNIENEEMETEEIELLNDFFFVNDGNGDSIVQNVISLCSGRLKSYGDYQFLDNIQIITPTKKGIAGTHELNKILQEKLNGPDNQKMERQYGDIIFRENDRVMQVKNNYNIMWERFNKIESKKEFGNGVFNGELGIIEKIDSDDKTVLVKFDDDKRVIYQSEDLEELEHAYAITIHKAQGSEFDVVILPIYQIAPMLQTRNLLYTAITRAKRLIIIIGNKNTVDFMIKNNSTKNRNTGLCYKLCLMSKNIRNI